MQRLWEDKVIHTEAEIKHLVSVPLGLSAVPFLPVATAVLFAKLRILAVI